MASTFSTELDEVEWMREIRSAERAVSRLLEAKRKTLSTDPVQEQALWSRHRARLQNLKRMLDAAVM